MDSIIVAVRKELENQIDARTQEISQSFFKEKIKSYGVKSAIVGKIGKEHFLKNMELSKFFITAPLSLGYYNSKGQDGQQNKVVHVLLK